MSFEQIHAIGTFPEKAINFAQEQSKTFSYDTKEIIGAFIALQSELKMIKKDSKSMHHNYASLAATINTIKPLLKKYDMGMTQILTFDHLGNSILKTYVLHSSGQWICSCFPLQYLFDITINKSNSPNYAQSFGSLLSYGKRYALHALFGVDDVDDDGDSLIINATLRQAQTLQNDIVKRCQNESMDVKEFTSFHKINSKDIQQMKSILEQWNIKKDEFLNKK